MPFCLRIEALLGLNNFLFINTRLYSRTAHSGSADESGNAEWSISMKEYCHGCEIQRNNRIRKALADWDLMMTWPVGRSLFITSVWKSRLEFIQGMGLSKRISPKIRGKDKGLSVFPTVFHGLTRFSTHTHKVRCVQVTWINLEIDLQVPMNSKSGTYYILHAQLSRASREHVGQVPQLPALFCPTHMD